MYESVLLILYQSRHAALSIGTCSNISHVSAGDDHHLIINGINQLIDTKRKRK